MFRPFYWTVVMQETQVRKWKGMLWKRTRLHN